jgi:hypothetical protein
MTIRHQLFVAILACVLVDITGAAAQQTKAPAPTPPTAPTAPTAPSPPAALVSPPPRPPTAKPDVNIQIDATIQSQAPSTPPLSKSITAIVSNGGGNSFRVQPGDQAGPRLNGDFKATIRDGRIELFFLLDVYITEADAPGLRYRGSNERILLENGRTMIVSKVPDPLTNRTITVTMMATILK